MAKILLIEDDDGLREMYEMRLGLEGYNVVVAVDGEEGLMKAETEKPNLILLDLMIPKISGMDVLEKLKNNQATVKIPVIIMTALDQEENKVKGLSLGAEDYIVKARVMPDEVVSRVAKILSIK